MHEGVEPDCAAMQLLEPIVAGRTAITCLIDRRRERVSPIQHAQDAGDDRHGLHPDHRPSVFLVAERPGDERRQRDRSRDRTPEVIPGKERADELAAGLLRRAP